MFPFAGEIFALAAALTWAVALVLFRLSGERVEPMALNLFKNVVAVVLMAATLALWPEGWNTLLTAPPEDLLILVISGIIGITIADTILFYSLNLVGVGILSILECAYTPFCVLFAWILLSEELGWAQYVGAALILAGVLLSSGHKPPQERTRGQMLAGVLLGLFAMACIAFGIVWAKPVIGRVPVIWAAVLRLFAGSVLLAGLCALTPDRGRLWSVFRPSRTWLLTIPASFFGAYLSMIFWIAGFKFTGESAIAAVLNQTSSIFALLLATIVLKEPFSRRKLAAIGLAVAGVLLVRMN